MSVMFNRFKIAHCLFRTKASIFTRQTDTRTNDGIDTIVHKIPFECTQGQYLSKYAITFNKGNEIEHSEGLIKHRCTSSISVVAEY